MEKPNFVNVNGGIKLPIGYRFHPTDEELLVHYLRRKVFGVPLPASVIPELDVFRTDPWTLPGDLKEKRYFFSKKWGKDDASESKSCKRVAGSGYWKPIGKGRQIVASFSKHVIGIRKTLIFYQGNNKHSNDSKTQWVMHEYHLVASGIMPNKTHQVAKMKLGEWVVYRIFQKKRRPNNKQGMIVSTSLNTSNEVIINSSFMEFTVAESSYHVDAPQPSSPFSSEITTDRQVSSSLLHEEEIDSSINVSSFHSCMKKI